jgi:hypothetical protein
MVCGSVSRELEALDSRARHPERPSKIAGELEVEQNEMEIVLLLVLLVVIGGGGYYVSHRPTVTPEEQDKIVHS